MRHEEFAGYVYNLSVEGDESYVAEGVGVHNCTANATAAALEFDAIKQGESAETPSRLFIYYGERVIEGTVSQDSGAQIRDGVKVAATQGVPPETDWPYDIAKFADQPPQKAYQDATQHKAVQYLSVAPTHLRSALRRWLPRDHRVHGVHGLREPGGGEERRANMPAAGEKVLGGHAVLVVGYDDSTQRFRVRNSWGPDWGQKGYFTMPYAYLLDRRLSQDFWTVSRGVARGGAPGVVGRRWGRLPTRGAVECRSALRVSSERCRRRCPGPPPGPGRRRRRGRLGGPGRAWRGGIEPVCAAAAASEAACGACGAASGPRHGGWPARIRGHSAASPASSTIRGGG